MFHRAPARFARGERSQSILQDPMEDIKWQDSGR
jgi:hypothetical protein